MVVGAISTRKISNEKDLLIYNNKKKKNFNVAYEKPQLY